MDTPTNFDPVTGQPIVVNTMEPKKKKTGLIIGIIIAVVVLAAAAVACFFLFLKKDPKTQIAEAIKNTTEEYSKKNLLLKDLSFPEYSESKEKTVEFEIETEIPSVGDVSVNATSTMSEDVMQVYGDVNVSFIPSIKFVLQLDDKNLSLYSPLLEKYLFTYGYKNDNTGYVANALKAQNVDLNEILSGFYDAAFKSGNEETSEKLLESFKELGEDLEFEKADAKDYEIDGKDVSCKGYSTKISVDELKDCIMEYYKSIDEMTANAIKVNGMSYSEIMEQAFSQSGAFDEIEEFEVVFYLNEDMLAGITMQPNDQEKLEFAFKGGDYRAQNIDILVDDEVKISLEAEIDSDVETYKLTVPEEDSFGLLVKYDSNNGALSIGTDADGQSITLDFEISKSKNKMEIEMKTIDFGDVYFGGKMTLSTGSELKDISADNVIDLGNASEADLQSVAMEIYSIIMGVMGQ